ncbi:hypothetical protein SAMN05216588_12458 [Pseudomonas flavescens]|uniref:Uncharacterized protein n=1 Tax=Phytopseudomonas flavescens TaxID=29435 RepID=A0A1G8NBF4_9GAMM|nr:hypothetical protein SAMN05216588_12458 [Pseudomonas flavescens]
MTAAPALAIVTHARHDIPRRKRSVPRWKVNNRMNNAMHNQNVTCVMIKLAISLSRCGWGRSTPLYRDHRDGHHKSR